MTFTEALSAVFVVVGITDLVGLFFVGLMTGIAVSTFYWMHREFKLKNAHINAIEELRKEFMEIRDDIY